MRKTCFSTSCCTWERWRRFSCIIGARSGRVRGIPAGREGRAAGLRSPLGLAGGAARDVATSPLGSFELFFKQRLEEMFKSSQAAGVGFLITAAVLLLVSLPAVGPERRRKGLRRRPGSMLFDRPRADVRPVARREPKRLDHRRGARARFSPTWSVGFSLLIAVPAICGAALSSSKTLIKDPAALGLTPDRIAQRWSRRLWPAWLAILPFSGSSGLFEPAGYGIFLYT